VKLWDVATGKLLSTLKEKMEGGIETLAISPDGKLLAAGGDDNTVKVWRLR
jgi:WD40 repeat protein